MTTLLALTAAAALTWIAVIGVAAMVPLLYWPRRFSGPLTSQERRLVGRALRGRSLVAALATPALTIAGLVLLLPPVVSLSVPGDTVGHPCDPGESRLSPLARDQSTASWVESVRCRARGAGVKALSEAILDAARDGFRVPEPCRGATLSAADLTSIELSLVEVAARAYHLTGVVLDPGPRFTDPDPWDILQRTLVARDVPVCRGDEAATGRDAILRLGPATVADPGASHHLEVPAVVRGNICEPSPGRIEDLAGELLHDCTLVPVSPADCAVPGQRALPMLVTCDAQARKRLRDPGRSGLRLSAGYGVAPIRRRELHVTLRVDPSIPEVEEALKSTLAFDPFIKDLQRRELERPRLNEGDAIVIQREGEDLVLARGVPIERSFERVEDLAELHVGPFSWSGVANVPAIECSPEAVRIRGGEALATGDDPTAKYATMNTLVWAANVLTNRTCFSGQARRDVRASRPLLDAAQLDAAVAALRRGREAAGLVCLALALALLALGLRRSAS